jgi:hypothetical protein
MMADSSEQQQKPKLTPEQKRELARQAVQALRDAESKLDKLAVASGDRKALLELLADEVRDVRRRVQTAVDDSGE